MTSSLMTSSVAAASGPVQSGGPWKELVLGGQKSGKSRRAEELALHWLASDAVRDTPDTGREAVLLATGQPWDAEMRERIARHQRDRALRVPGLQMLEAPLDVAHALRAQSAPHRLVIVDCLTLWLTNWLMPVNDVQALDEYSSKMLVTHDWKAQCAHFLEVLQQVPGPVVLVGNEIGLGVIPLGRDVRAFVDALGGLNQQVAACCDRVTLMCAGVPLAIKGGNTRGDQTGGHAAAQGRAS